MRSPCPLRVALVVVCLAAGCNKGTPTEPFNPLAPNPGVGPQGDGQGSPEERERSRFNLKLIGIAAHNYFGAFNRFPFPGAGPGGNPLRNASERPLLSWRVALLPYLEQETLYRQFKLDEPWDSEHNKKLIPLMPQVYTPVGGATTSEPGMTFYRIFVGPQAWQAGMGLANVPDGTANTIMVIEAGEPVVWTKPDELPYDAKKPLPKLGGLFGGDFHVLMADGSTRLVRKTIGEDKLRAAITANGGELLDLDWDR